MKERNTFSLFFNIRKDRQDYSGQVMIYLRITANGEKSAFSINHKAEVNTWDVKRGVVKSRAKNALEVQANHSNLW